MIQEVLMVDILLEVIRPFRGYILPLAFFGFFALVGVGLYRNDQITRSGVVASIFALLLVTSLLGLPLYPAVPMHKFEHAPDDTDTYHDIVLIDENGNELQIDTMAADPLGPRESRLGEIMAGDANEELTEGEREELSAFLIEQANEYAADVESSTLEPRALQYPEHTLRPIDWDAETLENYGEFVGLAVDEHWLEYSEDGTGIADEEVERVYEYRGDGQ